MYELIQAGARTYYIESPAKVGVFLGEDGGACLIDSGNDKDAGRRILKIMGERGWSVSAIVNTHSHADHIGGNRFIRQRTGCAVFAGGIEGAVTRSPILEPSLLYGACPPPELRHKFLMAQGSDAKEFSSPDFPAELEIIPLPGHCFEMAGFRTPDDVVFLADCVSSAATLEKYQIGYLYDVAAYLETLERVGQMKAKLFIPSHAEPEEDMTQLLNLNRDKVYEIGDRIAELCETPRSTEGVLKGLFDLFGLEMDFSQYALLGATVRSYLTWLYGAGRIAPVFRENMLLWSRS